MAGLRHFDVIVIGGGSGLTAAYHAGKDGRSVAVIEANPNALGGTCVNRGCIPTKSLIQAADVMRTIRGADAFGIRLDQSSVHVDFNAVMEMMRRRRSEDSAQVKSWVDKSFAPFYDRARFVGDKQVEMADGTRLTADRIFIASGARPMIPDIPGLAGSGCWTNETILELEEQPSSLLIIGGGYVGCEFGHFFASIGTSVTMVDRAGCLLREDDDVRELFTQAFGERATLLLETEVAGVKAHGERFTVTLQGNGGGEIDVGALLVATGRRPNTDTLDLAATGVACDDEGWVRVDDHLRTTHPDIYAYGDVIGQGMFKHTSSYEGELAYRNAQGANRQVSYRANPHAVFADPQIGSVGLTERECRSQGLRYTCVRKPYSSIAKGRILGAPDGFAKLLLESDSDRILGFHMIGPHAAELIHEVVVAMNAPGGTAAPLREAIHVHPTLPELVRAVFEEAGQ